MTSRTRLIGVPDAESPPFRYGYARYSQGDLDLACATRRVLSSDLLGGCFFVPHPSLFKDRDSTFFRAGPVLRFAWPEDAKGANMSSLTILDGQKIQKIWTSRASVPLTDIEILIDGRWYDLSRLPEAVINPFSGELAVFGDAP